MRCPACSHPLTVVQAAGAEVDACDGGCGGIWFDAFELRRFGDRLERSGVANVVEIDAGRQVDRSRRRRCPRCLDVVLMRRLHGPGSDVTVDECPGCGGLWLDAGELAQVRQDLERRAGERAAALERTAAALPAQVADARRENAHEQLERVRTAQAVVKLAAAVVFRGFGRGLLP